MKLLCIEDNKNLVASLKSTLGDKYKVTVARTGEKGINQALSSKYDLIILDLGLPDMNGSEVCKAIRHAHVSTPILVLSGTTESANKATLLNLGADDYVNKPFDGTELSARLKALRRRGHLFDTGVSGHLQIDDLVLDPVSRTVKRGGKLIDLRRKEFDILEYLIRNQNRVVTRDMILSSVWENDKELWDNTVYVHVKHLRDKIDRPFKRKLIRTVYGVGYTINHSVVSKN
jgi:two-component system, OmpR family, copper resistance phosphate regulon response regulator CusR